MIPLRKFITGTRICPTIVAHRGDWSDAPENSLRAIREAARKGFEIAEIDIRRSRDGAFFLLHDCGLDRMTTECGRASDRTLAELVSTPLLARDGRHRNMETGEHIPSLTEALAVAKGRIYFDLDVKEPEDLPRGRAHGREDGHERLLQSQDESAGPGFDCPAEAIAG